MTFEGPNLVVRSLVDREEGGLDFASTFISYIDLLDHRRHRKEHLRRHYYFECACERCAQELDGDVADPERSMFCVSCASCGDAMHVGCAAGGDAETLSPDPCPGCGHKVTEGFILGPNLTHVKVFFLSWPDLVNLNGSFTCQVHL